MYVRLFVLFAMKKIESGAARTKRLALAWLALLALVGVAHTYAGKCLEDGVVSSLRTAGATTRPSIHACSRANVLIGMALHGMALLALYLIEN